MIYYFIEKETTNNYSKICATRCVSRVTLISRTHVTPPITNYLRQYIYIVIII